MNKITVDNIWQELTISGTFLTLQNVGNNPMRVWVDTLDTGVAPIETDVGYVLQPILDSTADNNMTIEEVSNKIFVYSQEGTTAVF